MERQWLKGTEESPWEEFASFESWIEKEGLETLIKLGFSQDKIDMKKSPLFYGMVCEFIDNEQVDPPETIQKGQLKKEAGEPLFNENGKLKSTKYSVPVGGQWDTGSRPQQ